MSNPGIFLGHSASLTQTQTLAPQMRQSLKVLQMPMHDLLTEINCQLENNPLIEDVSNPREVLMSVAEPDKSSAKSAADGDVPLDFTPSGTAAEDILGSTDGTVDYLMTNNIESAPADENANTRRQRLFDLQVSTESLQEHLVKQIATSDIDPQDRPLAELIVSYIDETGYFKGTFADLQMVSGATEKKLNAVHARILKFDPTGCGARDLRECLLAQMDKLDDSPWQDEVRRLVARHLEDMAANRVDEICAKLKLTPEEYVQAKNALRMLDPKPGYSHNPAPGANNLDRLPLSQRPEYIDPEVTAVKCEGKWKAVVKANWVPDIRISQKYMDMLEDPSISKQDKEYLVEKIRSAHEFVDAIDNRHETIRKIAQAIFDAQPDFFEKGMAGLKPLTMEKIAENVGFNGSTVSRAVNGKYVSTPRGTLELRRFFSSGFTDTATGAEVSTEVVKGKLREIVKAEDACHPLSDEKIAAALDKYGFKIARRTVAKYREALGIPSASDRRLK